MNRQSEPHLDSFEAALLTELRSVVAETAVGEPALTPPVRRIPRRRALAAAAAAVLVASLGVHALWPTPAYAVTERNNGEVTVRVNRLEGAEALERELADHGIAADVTYLPEGKACAAGRYAAIRTPGLMLGVGSDFSKVTIPPGAVGERDTFVLSASVVPLPNGFRASVDFDIAVGAVAPCRVIDAP